MDILPVACTLSQAELDRHAHCLIPSLLKRSPELTQLNDGVRLEFDAAPDMIRQVTEVIERERNCCRFLQFVLTVPPGGKPFQLEITGPEGTRDFLDTALGIEAT